MTARAAAKTVLSATGIYRARLQYRSYRGAAVLAFHGIRPPSSPRGAIPFEQLHVTTTRFEEHCRVLRDLCRPLTFDEWECVAAGGRAVPAGGALVTFDDGYRTVLTEALPILERYRIPAVIFACTDPIARGRRFWFDTMAARKGEQAVERAKELAWSDWREVAAAHDEPADPGP